MKWSHDGLAHDLAQHLRADPTAMVWEDMQMGPMGSPRPDVYLIHKRYSRFTPIAYEVKVSVSDFRSDVTAGKWQSYLQYASAVVFAVPAGLVTKADIPDGCGLIVRHDNMWRHVKKPTLQRIETLPHEAWMKMLIDGIDRVAADQFKLRKANSNAYFVEQRLRKRHGDEVAKLVSEALRSRELVQDAIEKSEAQRKEIEESRHRHYRLAIENVTRDLNRLTSDQAELAEALGLPRDAEPRTLAAACRKAVERLTGDEEVQSLRRHLRDIQRSLERGLEPLPGEVVQ